MKALGWSIVLLVIAAVLVVGWLLVAGGQSTPTAPNTGSPAAVPEAAAPAGEPGTTLLAPETVPAAGNPAAPVAEQPGAAGQEQAVLAAIAPYTGSGTATRSFDGTTFSHAVTAAIADPAAGKFYEGWLVMPTPAGPEFFSTGAMEKSGANYVLSYSSAKNYPFHNKVVITEETSAQGLDNNPEAHVLEGSFE